MNKKGFTLVEVLVVFVIIVIIAGIGIISYKSFFDVGEANYYKALESDVLLAANDYFLDHRDRLPVASEYGEVQIIDLVDEKYIEEVKDSNGKQCEGSAVVYKDSNQYAYEACLICDDYKSSGKYCKNDEGQVVTAKINMTAKRTISGTAYDVNNSYEETGYSNENIEVTFNTTNATISKYVIVNTGTGDVEECPTGNSNICKKTYTQTGTYYVTAYDNNNKVVVKNKRMIIKIMAQTTNFEINGIEDKYKITSCGGDKKVRVNFSIAKNANFQNETFKKIEYKVMRNGTEYIARKEIPSTTESMYLPTGHYELMVYVTNLADNVTNVVKGFDVAYDVNIEYDDDHSTATHEVVQGYSYDYLAPLPKTKRAYGVNGLEIRWFKNDVRMTGETVVVEDCTHNIEGRMAIPVQVPNNLTTYCKDVTYDETKQVLTKAAPENITFLNNEQTNAGSYTIKAHINAPLYIWSDGTFEDKTFTCSMKKAQSTLTCADRTYTGSEQAMYSAFTGCASVTNGKQTNAGGPWTLTCNPDNNHLSPTTGTCNATMNKKASTVTLNKTSVTLTYPTAQTVTISGTGNGTLSCSSNATGVATCSISGNTLTITPQANTADGKTATITVKRAAGNNYSEKTATVSVTVNRGTLNCPGTATSTVTYNTKEQSTSGNACPSGSTRGTAKGTNVGTYTANCTANSGYKFSSTCTNAKLVINKAASTVTLNKTSVTLTYPTAQTVTISGTGNGTLSCSSNATGVATCSISGNTLTITPKANTADNKTAVITVKRAATTNYSEKTATVSVTVNRKALTCPGTATSTVTYNAKEQSYSGNACPSGSTRGTAKGTNAGTYTANCTANSGYKFSSTCTNAKLVINKANLRVTVTAYDGEKDGNTHYATIKVTSSGWNGKTIVSGTSTSYGTNVTANGAVNTTYNLQPGLATKGTTTVYYKVTGGTNYNDKTGSSAVKIIEPYWCLVSAYDYKESSYCRDHGIIGDLKCCQEACPGQFNKYKDKGAIDYNCFIRGDGAMAICELKWIDREYSSGICPYNPPSSGSGGSSSATCCPTMSGGDVCHINITCYTSPIALNQEECQARGSWACGRCYTSSYTDNCH